MDLFRKHTTGSTYTSWKSKIPYRDMIDKTSQVLSLKHTALVLDLEKGSDTLTNASLQALGRDLFRAIVEVV
jgi:hypothetical protein